jgi:hypothetical protein
MPARTTDLGTDGRLLSCPLRTLDHRTFDLYLNGTVLGTGVKLAGVSTSLTRIELSSSSYSTTTKYTASRDDIVVLP